MSPTEITGYLAKADQVIQEKEELLRALEEEKKKTEKDRDRVFRSYLDEEIDVQTYGASSARWRKESARSKTRSRNSRERSTS